MCNKRENFLFTYTKKSIEVICSDLSSCFYLRYFKINIVNDKCENSICPFDLKTKTVCNESMNTAIILLVEWIHYRATEILLSMLAVQFNAFHRQVQKKTFISK